MHISCQKQAASCTWAPEEQAVRVAAEQILCRKCPAWEGSDLQLLGIQRASSTGVQISKQLVCILGPGPQTAAAKVQSPDPHLRIPLDWGVGRGAALSHKPTLLATFWSEFPALRMEICLACPAMHDGKFSPPLSRHPWLFCFILCAASYFILSTSFPSLHRYYRHAKAGWEGHNDLCLMLLPRLLRGAEGETLLLTTPPLTPPCPLSSPARSARPHPPQGVCREAQCIQWCVWICHL